jgi:hypothetical protein
MTTFTPEAQALLDHYLAEAKVALGESASVDSDDVLRDVRDHIERELAQHQSPVSVVELEEVLRRLGVPAQWAADSDNTLANRIAAQVVTRLSCRGVRRRSKRTFIGLPLWDIAYGPDIEKGEKRGRARGIIALGDVATGWLAIGGLARGGIALGGVAFGGIAIGGCAVGVLASGGAAIGGIAIGGGALGIVAIGGGMIGVFTAGNGQGIGYSHLHGWWDHLRR